MEVSGQLHAPANLPPRKEATSIHWIGGWVNPRACLDAVEKGKNLYLPGNELPSSSLKPVVISNELPLMVLFSLIQYQQITLTPCYKLVGEKWYFGLKIKKKSLTFWFLKYKRWLFIRIFFKVQDMNAYREGRMSSSEFYTSETTGRIFMNVFSENLDFELHIMACFINERTVKAEKQPLLSNACTQQ
jgi:hypothetical protein